MRLGWGFDKKRSVENKLSTANVNFVHPWVEGIFERGFLCYGVPIGIKSYVKHVLKA